MMNLFVKTDDHCVVCAIPDGGALPSFLRGRKWRFEGKIVEFADDEPDSGTSNVEAMIRLNGFYVYVRKEPPVRWTYRAKRSSSEASSAYRPPA